jgi:hypothetical protein
LKRSFDPERALKQAAECPKRRAIVTTHRYLSPPERCESLASIVARCGGAMELQSAATVMEYALPRHATDEVRHFWQPETRAQIAPGFIANLPAGRVFGAGMVLAPDGESLARDVSLDFGKPFQEHWLLRYGKIPPPTFLKGATAVIATTLGTGYGHWLLDELPRLLALSRDAAEMVIAHAAPPFSRVALERCGWTGGAVIPAGRGLHFHCERLVVPSLVGTVVQPARGALDRVVEFASAYYLKESAFGERIYLTRERARRRRVINEPELWGELERSGFVKVRLEELTWPEQINAFRHAKVVVAPHGAGLANLAFCQPGTRVVELFNRAYLHGCFWRLAALQRLDYWPMVPAGAELLGQAMSCNRLDIRAELGPVRAALRAL